MLKTKSLSFYILLFFFSCENFPQYTKNYHSCYYNSECNHAIGNCLINNQILKTISGGNAANNSTESNDFPIYCLPMKEMCEGYCRKCAKRHEVTGSCNGSGIYKIFGNKGVYGH